MADPVIDRPDAVQPEHEALLADAVGMALMTVLQTLPPPERVALVLHDSFAVPFEEIATILDKTPAATRQLASRARRKVQEAPTTPEPDLARQRAVVDAVLRRRPRRRLRRPGRRARSRRRAARRHRARRDVADRPRRRGRRRQRDHVRARWRRCARPSSTAPPASSSRRTARSSACWRSSSPTAASSPSTPSTTSTGWPRSTCRSSTDRPTGFCVTAYVLRHRAWLFRPNAPEAGRPSPPRRRRCSGGRTCAPRSCSLSCRCPSGRGSSQSVIGRETVAELSRSRAQIPFCDDRAQMSWCTPWPPWQTTAAPVQLTDALTT